MKTLLIGLTFLLLIGSCSKKDSEQNKICFTRTMTDLKIENNTNKTIYFTAFGQNILPLIDWIPSCSNSGVAANSSVSKNLSTITGYLQEDKLIVYWWECTANKAGAIHSVLLNKYDRDCQ